MTKIARIAITLLLLSYVLSGCLTFGIAHNTFIGDPVELDFRVVHADLPNAMIYWQESPDNNESALTFNPPYTGCTEVNFYVNPMKKNAKPLKHNTKEVALITLDNASEELALWARIPINDKCAVLLSVGTITDIGFTGISASTRAGQFKRVNIAFSKPKPPDSSALPAVVFTPLFEALFWPSYALHYPLARPLCPPAPESVKVTFHFPDNTFKEAVITHARANELIEEPFMFFGCDMYCPNELCVSYWLIAAMLDLRLEFRYFMFSGALTIESYQGKWNYRINGDKEIKSDYRNAEVNIHQIDFFLNTGSSSDLYSKSAWELNKDINTHCPNADLGHADAQAHVGDLYYFGKYNLNKDIIQAYVWYRLAAENGSSIADSKVHMLEIEMSNDYLIEAISRFEQWQPGSCRKDLLKAASGSSE